MEQKAKEVAAWCTAQSDAEAVTFPQVIGALMEAGIERYRADLCRNEKTYYMPDGSSHVTPCHAVPTPAPVFDAAGVEAAVRASQRGEIKYGEFCRRATAAGCVDYLVTLTGRRVVYYGRNGSAHIEHFPAAT